MAEIHEKALKNRQNPPINDPSVFQLFPNPTSGVFRINFQEILTEDAQVDIADVSGRVVYRAEILRGVFYHLVDSQNWADGIYIVRLQTEKGILARKFVKANP